MGFLTTLFAGPLTGLLGSIFGAVMKSIERKQQLEADKEKYAHERGLLEMNIAARGQEMESEAMIAQMEAMAKMVAGSYQHDTNYGPVSQGAATALRFVRPGLTLLLFLLVTAMYFSVTSIEDGSEYTLQQQIVMTVLYLFEVAFTWWFADRARESKK